MLIVPPRRQGLLVGGLLALITLLLDGFWLWQLLDWPITFLSFVQAALVLLSIPWLILLFYWLYGLASLRYHLDRNRLFVRWGATWQVIPLPAVERTVVGVRLVSPASYRGAWWPGYWAGRGTVEGVGTTLFYASRPLARQIVLVTPTTAYALSPPDPEAFLRELAHRRSMGPTQAVAQTSHRPAWVDWPILHDKSAQGFLALGILTGAMLFARLCGRYPALPDRVAFHFDAQGQVDRIGQRAELFILPVIGWFVLAVNQILGLWLYRRERVGAYLMWGSVVAVHVLLWLALAQLTG
ncbi:MAG: PH domain-containing protein [Chloroflexota bacterium]